VIKNDAVAPASDKLRSSSRTSVSRVHSDGQMSPQPIEVMELQSGIEDKDKEAWC
jgi:hypothetical protein